MNAASCNGSPNPRGMVDTFEPMNDRRGCVLRTALVWKLPRCYSVDDNAVHIDKERLLIDRAHGGYRWPRLVAVLITA